MFVCCWSVKLEQINLIAKEDLSQRFFLKEDFRFGQALATT